MRRRWLGLLLGAVAVGCGASEEETTPGLTSGSGAGTSGSPTWWEDVAPIVYQNCLGCHTAGGIAPFTLESYADVKSPVAEVMALATEQRTMPPWHADNSGSCNTYRDARWLSDEQIATIGAWAKAGAPEGDAANAPTKPTPPTGLETATHALDIMVEYMPNADITDDYRCFVVDPGITQDMYLTAYEVKPGQPTVVHHVILYGLETAAEQQAAEQLDTDEPGPGYTCFGGPGAGSNKFIGGWAPGTAVTRYPENTGVLMAAGRKAVLQIHYNTLNGVLPDRTTMDLELVASVPKPAIIEMVANPDLSLPPGQDYVQAVGGAMNPSPVPLVVHGVYPHMHQLGEDLTTTFQRPSGDVCAVSVPDWNFHWQQFYFYEDPIVVLPGDYVEIACGYDTRGRTETITWGEGTQDEMCLTFFYLTE
jgi:hypothetical protein